MATQSRAVATTATPSLPGLLPDRRTHDLHDELAPFYEGRAIVVTRMLTPSERDVMTKRCGEIDLALAPAKDNRKDYLELEAKMALWFGGYTYLANTDTRGLVASFKVVLANLPVWAVLRAIKAVTDGDVKERDKLGRESPIDPNFAPSASKMREVAEGFMHDLVMEKSEAIKMLTASKVAQTAIVDPAMAERGGKILADLGDALRRGTLPSRRLLPGEPSAEQERERKAKSERESIERQQQAHREEYRRAGVTEPMMSSDGKTIVSLPMALRLGWRVQSNGDGTAIMVKP